jgi:preprotein translocase subunit SecB
MTVTEVSRMSAKAESGIQIHGIILKESNFSRNPVIPEDLKLEISFSITTSFEKNKTILVTEMGCSINGQESLSAKVTYVGIFSADPESVISLETYANYNAPATLLPYIREEIQSKMIKAQLPKYAILPAMNVQAIVDQAGKVSSSKKKSVSKK